VCDGPLLTDFCALELLAHGKLAADATTVLGGGDHPAVDRQTASDTKFLNFEIQL
jgi:hypothetical protein